MKTVLVVDDDPIILDTIASYLKTHSPELELVSARNGRQALEVLERQPVDLLLTDLYMPEMDGFELLAHMVRHFSSVPIVVMSGCEVPEIAGRLERQGALGYIEKPFDFASLADTVRRTLRRTSKGSLTGVSLLGFLQLLNFEKKSCTLTVHSGEREGRIHVVDGELTNAGFGRLEGESAMFEILSWEDCEIEIGVPQPVERLIHRSLHGVLLDAAKEEDESRAAAEAGVPAPAGPRPAAAGDEPLDPERRLRLREILQRPFEVEGVIGLALVDVQQSEVLEYACYHYWPDFTERAVVAAPALRRRLELSDGEQLEEVLMTLEALLEVWRPLGRDRRLVFYLLADRQRADPDEARRKLETLEREVLELVS